MIQFTKTYAVTHPRGVFKILLAKHEDDIVYGSIIYHTANQSNVIESRIETLPGTDEEIVLTNCIDWIHKNLPGDIEVMQVFV